MIIDFETEERLEKITFWGVPIEKEVRQKLEEINERATKGMTDQEKMIYEMGTYNTLSALEVVLSTDDDSIVVDKPHFDMVEELNLDELVKR